MMGVVYNVGFLTQFIFCIDNVGCMVLRAQACNGLRSSSLLLSFFLSNFSVICSLYAQLSDVRIQTTGFRRPETNRKKSPIELECNSRD